MTNVEVFRESDLSVDEVLAVEADHILIATGATWRAEGFGRNQLQSLKTLKPASQIFTPDDIMAGNLPKGPTVIFDDDSFYMGGVIAEKIQYENAPVTMVTPENIVSAWCKYTSEQYQVQKNLLKLGIHIRTAHRVLAYNGQMVTICCVHTGRQQSIEADALVMGTARSPQDELYQTLKRHTKNGRSNTVPFVAENR
jgi:dimethylamine/trimethylamine dehydrogenase